MYIDIQVYTHTLYKYDCMSVCTHECMSLYLYVCVSVCLSVCMYARMSACMDVCMYVYVRMHVCMIASAHVLDVRIHLSNMLYRSETFKAWSSSNKTV